MVCWQQVIFLAVGAEWRRQQLWSFKDEAKLHGIDFHHTMDVGVQHLLQQLHHLAVTFKPPQLFAFMNITHALLEDQGNNLVSVLRHYPIVDDCLC